MVLEHKWRQVGRYRLSDGRVVSLHRHEEPLRTKTQVYYVFKDESGKTCSEIGFEVVGNLASFHTRAKTRADFANKKLFTSLLRISLRELKDKGVTGVVTIFIPKIGKEDFVRKTLIEHGFKARDKTMYLDYGEGDLQKITVPYYVILDLQKLKIPDIVLEEVKE